MMRLRLDDSLRVLSVTSAEGGNHLFFPRAQPGQRDGGPGPLDMVQEFSLTVRYAGTHKPEAVEREVLQFAPRRARARRRGTSPSSRPGLRQPHGLVPLRQRRRLRAGHGAVDTPREYTGITGGIRTEARVERPRKVMEFRRTSPGKYITLVVGPLHRDGRAAGGARGLAELRPEPHPGRAVTRCSPRGRDPPFFETSSGPFPYPVADAAGHRGVHAGGPQPPRHGDHGRAPDVRPQAAARRPAGFNDIPDFFLAHELAHQWWGHGVAGENYGSAGCRRGARSTRRRSGCATTRATRSSRGVLRRMAQWALRETGEGPLNLGFRWAT
jgi:hypothetical protein